MTLQRYKFSASLRTVPKEAKGLKKSSLATPELQHGLARGVAEETAKIRHIVIVHSGGYFLNGEVGLGKIEFDLVNDHVVDEGFGRGLHQPVADFVQIVGADTQFGGVEPHTSLIVYMLGQERVKTIWNVPNGRLFIGSFGREALRDHLLNGNKEIVQLTVHHLLANFPIKGVNHPFHSDKPFVDKMLHRFFNGQYGILEKEIPKQGRVEIDSKIGDGGGVQLDKKAGKTGRDTVDDKAVMVENRHERPAPQDYGLKMRSANGVAFRTP